MEENWNWQALEKSKMLWTALLCFQKKICYQGIRRKDYSYNKKFLINHNTNTEWRCQVFWSISAAFSYLTASIHFGSKWVEQKIKNAIIWHSSFLFSRQTSIFLFSNFQKSISFFLRGFWSALKISTNV